MLRLPCVGYGDAERAASEGFNSDRGLGTVEWSPASPGSLCKLSCVFRDPSSRRGCLLICVSFRARALGRMLFIDGGVVSTPNKRDKFRIPSRVARKGREGSPGRAPVLLSCLRSSYCYSRCP